MTAPQVDKLPLEMLYHWTKQRPDALYMRQPVNGEYIDYSWKTVDRQVRHMAGYLKSLELSPGAPIGIFSKNCAHWLMADYAIMMAGHVSVPLYPNLTPDSIRQILLHAEVKHLFVGKLDNFDSMVKGIPEGVKTVNFPYPGVSAQKSWDDLIAKASPVTDFPTRHDNELATIIYTSGTSGQPKGVMQSFKSMAATGTLGCLAADIKMGDRFFSYLPLAHVGERALVQLGGLYSGGLIYFAESLDTFAENLRVAKPHLFLAVPRIWTKFQSGILAKLPQKKLNLLLSIPIVSSLIKRKIKKGLGLDEVKTSLTGAAPIPRTTLEWFKKLDIEIQEAYGMTENFAFSHFTRRGQVQFGSVGQPMPEVDVKISEAGEIMVRGPGTMKGYYKEPEMTAEMFAGEYLKTGDKGVIDGDGFLRITGRVKDLFKTSKGKYVAPSPIELLVAKSPMIEQVCVVGAGMPQPMALLVLNPAARDLDQSEISSHLDDLMQELNLQLDSHEKLKIMVVVKEEWTVENKVLTPSMKIKRAVIEEMYNQQYEPWYNQSVRIIIH